MVTVPFLQNIMICQSLEDQYLISRIIIIKQLLDRVELIIDLSVADILYILIINYCQISLYQTSG